MHLIIASEMTRIIYTDDGYNLLDPQTRGLEKLSCLL